MDTNDSTRNVVADGFYDCVVTGVRRQEKHFGKDCTMHLILSIGVRPESDDNAEIFYAELPVIFTVGKPWDFYDRAANKSVNRPCTSKDVAEAWEYAEKVFPAWAKHNAELPDGATTRDSIAWFDGCRETKVRAKLVNRLWSSGDKSGVAHDATLYAANSQTNVSDSFDMAFDKSLQASGIKIGKAAKKATAPAKPDSKPAVKPSAPAAKPNPPKPAAPAKTYTSDDSWNAYEENQKKVDPNGDKYWERVAEVTGKDAADWESFTSADWEKCVREFGMPF